MENFTDFFKKVEEKWQRIWEEKGVYQPEVDESKPKFFMTVPYPYVSGLLHLGSAYTYTRGDFIARYKRLRGYNVLWPQGWHLTGSPIVSRSYRLKMGDKKIIEDLISDGIPESDFKKLENPEGWAIYFMNLNREAFKKFGYSIDWRRELYTTYLNPWYDKFVKWQYRKLKEKNLITKGSHPVILDSKLKIVIGDHDRPDEYAGISYQEGIIIKFPLENKLGDIEGIFLPCFTLRSETIYGVTNIWINPSGKYVLAKVNSEYWILPNTIILEELRAQKFNVEIIREVSAEELIGKNAINPITKDKIPILPAKFVDIEIGTGIVMSVPSDAPYDYIALLDLTKDQEYSKIAEDCLRKMKPLFRLEGYSEFPARDIVEKLEIKSQEDRDKLEKATKEIYNKEFYNGIAREIYGKYAGKKVFEFKEEFEKEIIEEKIAVRYYTLPIRFVSRYNNKVIVGIVEDQWFLKYSDIEWKKLAHECVDGMFIYPENLKKVFHEYIEWYKDWACTHQKELGSTLPWDEKWTLESLSDSTLYTAFYTIYNLIKKIDPEKIGDDLFDYVFLGKGNKEELIRKYGEIIEEMRREFLYWYPVDIRTSGKDLIGNHFIFYIFHHTAIFPKELWPKGIIINGWVLTDGKKMSKSLGNYVSMKDAYEKYSVDALRFLIAYSGNSGLDDANLELSKVENAERYLMEWYSFCINNYNKGRVSEKLPVDLWFERVLYEKIKVIEMEYERLNMRNVINSIYDIDNSYKWYIKRCGEPHRDVINKYIIVKSIVLYPIVPHIVSEILERIGLDPLNPSWPYVEEVKDFENLDKREEYIRKIRDDISKILEIIRIEKPKKIKIIVARKEKYRNLKENYFIRNQEEELNILKDAATTISKEFYCDVDIDIEEKSSEEKSKKALPGKPAIIVI
ncbi:MAG: leucine--tRNA ligase [Candidatus Nanoclepta minutus]|uniref:Leucine--tRNA ligase n=1 Tax=Candidatus Nanoclepta minutus TaxID=1940235 RepID=A0A397WPW0_9ARCH|nr:MAG: leucine--tRNA ligase [Candidatus Nanoclepta minutus]